MARTLPLALVAFACALALVGAGCGGGEEVAPTPENVQGSVAQETLPDFSKGDPEAGKQVFTEIAQPACSSCHTYGPAGSSAEVGPNLDDALQGKDPQFIYESIVDPDAEIADGFSSGIMPKDYGEKLDDKQLADLVAFLTPKS
jgi:mono/diheme cytochrome c family protein